MDRLNARAVGALGPEREIDRLVRVGDDVALLNVRASKCSRCGELLLSRAMVERLERARKQLADHSTAAPVIEQVYDLRTTDAA